ncbi:MAG: UDP-N-acetylglucosamine--N-acetylmuramyl-(pentapeptide) pyrophosphoryl-undecaprenol [Chitinophagaceae bacterium]|nr:UDP-N-acetylglucosamine--N-acetylmuramyl-(pentapeptide) pyrophosphoryl-undecaprenol [Chitinophagaceae bacterium]
MKRIIIAGGGTGGHIFPAVAIANAIKHTRPEIQILFVGAKGRMEMEKVPQAGYEIKGLDIAGFDRSSLIKNFALPYKLIKSFWQVRNIFKTFKPDAVIGVGGYSSFPVLKFAQAKGIYSFIHESNSFAGKSNMMLGKSATKVFVATDGMERFFPAAKLMVTGNPVRKNILNTTIGQPEALQHFGLEPGKKTILAVGGSLGARSINEALAEGLNRIIENDLQLIWQTGKTTAEKFMAVGKDRKGIWVDAFINEMEDAYMAADVVISRAGAMAVSELCVVKKPVIFVPYPLAAEDHQTVNAKHLADKRAALMIKDSDAKDQLVNKVIELAKNDTLQNDLKQNIGSLSVTDADQRIAKEILKTISE